MRRMGEIYKYEFIEGFTMKKIVATVLVLICLFGILICLKWNVIFQKGNPIPYLIAASKITEENPYIEVEENIVISKNGECLKLFEDFEESFGVEYTEQAGSGYIFTDGNKNYTITSEIYWGKYKVWILPTNE